MKYSNFKLEDFLLDKQFIEWVSQQDREADRFWENWVKSNPHQLDNVLKAREIILSMEFDVPVPGPAEKQEVLGKILKGQNSERLYRINNKSNHGITWYKVAASLIFIISFGIFFLLQLNKTQVTGTEQAVKIIEKSNPAGRKSQIKLPDGSIVNLNAASNLSFSDPFVGENRIVNLKGEAFFEVMEDVTRPFIVRTPSIQVHVIGTSFNMNENSVALLSGKVAVSKLDDDEKTIALSPGQKATLDSRSNTIIKSNYDYLKEMGWKDGIIYFSDASFQEIKNTIERWYGVKIFSQYSFEWNYTGSFDNVSLDNLLERLAYLQNFRYEIKNKEVKLYQK
jgi:transmembrane sensor